MGLCFRCEHRAIFLEEDKKPRAECGNSTRSVVSCYMFTPTKPITVKRSVPNDDRPLSLNILGARVKQVFNVNVEQSLSSGTSLNLKDVMLPHWVITHKQAR